MDDIDAQIAALQAQKARMEAVALREARRAEEKEREVLVRSTPSKKGEWGWSRVGDIASVTKDIAFVKEDWSATVHGDHEAGVRMGTSGIGSGNGGLRQAPWSIWRCTSEITLAAATTVEMTLC
jgi:hypothetical protein